MLDTLEDWTRPKSDEVAAFIQLRTLNQGNKTIYLHSRSEESGRSMQFQLCGRLHRQADQKFHCSRPQQYQSIPVVYLKGIQSHPEGGAWPQVQDYRHSNDITCELCGSRPHKYRSECKASGQECFYCGRLGHFSKMCKQNPENQNSDKTEVKHIDMEEQSPDYTQSEYTTRTTSQVTKQKHQLNASRLQQKSIICTTKT